MFVSSDNNVILNYQKELGKHCYYVNYVFYTLSSEFQSW